MKIKVIKTEKDYQTAITRMEELGDLPDFEVNQELVDEFELLEKLVDLYEKEYHSIEKGNPIEIIKLKMAYLDLSQKDLIPYVGSKGVVSMVMNKKRALSKNMIRNLSKFLNISQEILNTPYELNIEEFNVQQEDLSTKINPNPFGLNPELLECVLNYSEKVKSKGMLLNYCSS